MDNLIFKAFIPELFLSFALLAQLLYNIKKTTTFKYKLKQREKWFSDFDIFFVDSLWFWLDRYCSAGGDEQNLAGLDFICKVDWPAKWLV